MERKETVTLIIFIIATTLLSTAQSIVTTGLAGIMADFQYLPLLLNGYTHHFYLFWE